MFALTLEPSGTVLPINAFPVCSISCVKLIDGNAIDNLPSE